MGHKLSSPSYASPEPAPGGRPAAATGSSDDACTQQQRTQRTLLGRHAGVHPTAAAAAGAAAPEAGDEGQGHGQLVWDPDVHVEHDGPRGREGADAAPVKRYLNLKAAAPSKSALKKTTKDLKVTLADVENEERAEQQRLDEDLRSKLARRERLQTAMIKASEPFASFISTASGFGSAKLSEHGGKGRAIRASATDYLDAADTTDTTDPPEGGAGAKASHRDWNSRPPPVLSLFGPPSPSSQLSPSAQPSGLPSPSFQHSSHSSVGEDLERTRGSVPILPSKFKSNPAVGIYAADPAQPQPQPQPHPRRITLSGSPTSHSLSLASPASPSAPNLDLAAAVAAEACLGLAPPSPSTRSRLAAASLRPTSGRAPGAAATAADERRASSGSRLHAGSSRGRCGGSAGAAEFPTLGGADSTAEWLDLHMAQFARGMVPGEVPGPAPGRGAGQLYPTAPQQEPASPDIIDPDWSRGRQSRRASCAGALSSRSLRMRAEQQLGEAKTRSPGAGAGGSGSESESAMIARVARGQNARPQDYVRGEGGLTAGSGSESESVRGGSGGSGKHSILKLSAPVFKIKRPDEDALIRAERREREEEERLEEEAAERLQRRKELQRIMVKSNSSMRRHDPDLPTLHTQVPASASHAGWGSAHHADSADVLREPQAVHAASALPPQHTGNGVFNALSLDTGVARVKSRTSAAGGKKGIITGMTSAAAAPGHGPDGNSSSGGGGGGSVAAAPWKAAAGLLGGSPAAGGGKGVGGSPLRLNDHSRSAGSPLHLASPPWLQPGASANGGAEGQSAASPFKIVANPKDRELEIWLPMGNAAAAAGAAGYQAQQWQQQRESPALGLKTPGKASAPRGAMEQELEIWMPRTPGADAVVAASVGNPTARNLFGGGGGGAAGRPGAREVEVWLTQDTYQRQQHW